jgi:hypothetical protein
MAPTTTTTASSSDKKKGQFSGIQLPLGSING